MADQQDSMGKSENGYDSRRSNMDRSRSRSRSRSRDRRDRRRDRGEKPRTDNLKSKRVYICNLPYEAKWQDIKDLMKKEVGDAYVELYDDHNGKPTGCGCVEFRSIELAKECIEKMYRFDYKGRGLVVREEKDKDRERHGKDGGGDRMMNVGGGGGGGGGGHSGGFGGGFGGSRDTGFSGSSMPSSSGISPSAYRGHELHGLPIDILMELEILPPLVNQVFVSNLPYKISSDRLKEVFSVAGNVLRSEIIMDNEGKSKGKGIVEYESPKEAVEAIALLKDQWLVDRQICVHMDKKAKGDEKRLPHGLKTLGKSISMRTGTRMGGSGMSDFGSSSGMGSSSLSSSMMGSSMMSDNMNMMGNYGTSQGMMGSGMSSMRDMGNMSNMSNMGNMGGMSNMSGMSGMSSMGSGGTSSGFGGMSNMNQSYSSMGNFGMGSGSSMLGNTDTGFSSSGMSGMSNYGMSDMNRNMSMSGMGMSSGLMSNTLDSGRSTGMSGMSGMSGGRSESRRGGGGDDDYTVIVKNLDYKVSWQDLKDHFRSCGEVKYAKIMTDDDNKSRGQGIVRFRSMADMQKAMDQFNGSKFQGRTLRLKLDDGK